MFYRIILGAWLLPVIAASAAYSNDVVGTYKRVQLDINEYVCPGRSAPAEIEIRRTEQGTYRVTGFALWVQNVAIPAPHTAEFDFTGILQGDSIYLMNHSSTPIDIKLVFSEENIMVSDEGNAGGLHVTFTGEYQKIDPLSGDNAFDPIPEGVICHQG